MSAPHPTGWRNSPAEVKRILGTLPHPRFATAGAGLAGTGAGKTVLLSDAAKKVTGKHLPAQKQPRGTCVSRGWSRAVDYLQCVMIAQGAPLVYQSISHAAVYGLAKEVGGDIGQQNQSENGDGAVGAWAAKAVTDGGTTSNESDGDVDANSDDLAIKYAVGGVPAAIKALCVKHLVKTTSLVTTADQGRDSICNGYPLSVCSDQGFSMTRDSQGRCRPEGSWSHCMMWSAYRADRDQFLVEQSWGQMTPDGPIGDLDIPDNAFWIDRAVAERMLRQEDSFALSGFDGYPAQTLSWLL